VVTKLVFGLGCFRGMSGFLEKCVAVCLGYCDGESGSPELVFLKTTEYLSYKNGL
jgi:peptide methionine sulfoxide reductase MsrA